MELQAIVAGDPGGGQRPEASGYAIDGPVVVDDALDVPAGSADVLAGLLADGDVPSPPGHGDDGVRIQPVYVNARVRHRGYIAKVRA